MTSFKLGAFKVKYGSAYCNLCKTKTPNKSFAPTNFIWLDWFSRTLAHNSPLILDKVNWNRSVYQGGMMPQTRRTYNTPLFASVSPLYFIMVGCIVLRYSNIVLTNMLIVCQYFASCSQLVQCIFVYSHVTESIFNKWSALA